VLQFGPLDGFSAFKFENYLGQIKRLLKNGSNSISQIHRRLVERHNIKRPISINSGKFSLSDLDPHAPSADASGFVYYKQLVFNGSRNAKTRPPDNIVIMSDDTIVCCKHFVTDEAGTEFVIERKLKIISDFFFFPCSSGLLKTVCVGDLSKSTRHWPV